MSEWRYDSANCKGYYKLEPSISLKPEMDGALVRRRISKKEFEARRNECLQAVEKFEQWHANVPA